MLRPFVTALMLLSLVGCLSVPITSIPKLSALNPETADFMAMEAAVRVPEGYRIYKDRVKLGFTLETEGLDTEKLDLFMLPVEEPLTDYLQSQRRNGSYIARFQVNPEDEAAATAFRIEGNRRRADFKGQNNLRISATAGGCLAEGTNPFSNMRMTFYLRSAPDKEFFPLTRNISIPIASGEDGRGISTCTEDNADRLLPLQ